MAIELPQKVVSDEWFSRNISLNEFNSAENSLTFEFVRLEDNLIIECTTMADGSFLLEVEGLGEVGHYSYQAKIVNALSGKVSYVATGRIESTVGFGGQIEGHDTRSHVKKVLDALKAMIENKASKDQIYYMIEGRALSRIPPEDLLNWLGVYQKKYTDELNAEKRANGKKVDKILVEFI